MPCLARPNRGSLSLLIPNIKILFCADDAFLNGPRKQKKFCNKQTNSRSSVHLSGVVASSSKEYSPH